MAMADSPEVKLAKTAERGAREARLAAALRDNLHRRKKQARARAADLAASDTPFADAPAEPRSRPRGDSGSTG